MTLQQLLSSYDEIKLTVPSYRLGQHIVNSLGLRTQHTKLCPDLFYIEDDKKSYDVFLAMCEEYCWDESDLPVFNK
jgi:hypothetical protein